METAEIVQNTQWISWSLGRDEYVNNKFSMMTIGAYFIKQFLQLIETIITYTRDQIIYLFRFYRNKESFNKDRIIIYYPEC